MCRHAPHFFGQRALTGLEKVGHHIPCHGLVREPLAGRTAELHKYVHGVLVRTEHEMSAGNVELVTAPVRSGGLAEVAHRLVTQDPVISSSEHPPSLPC